MTIAITSSGIALDGPLVAGEKVAVTVSGLALAAEDKPTLALLARFPDALLASVELAESETAGTWTGELDTATKQTALFFATARADERRDAALELVAGRVSLARLTVPMANSALCPKPDGSPFASPVYVPVPGPPGTGGDPYEQNPEMDGAASPGTSDEYARGDHRHPTDTTRQAVIEDLAAIRSGAAAGATAVQPSALSRYRTATEQDAIDAGKLNATGLTNNNGQLGALDFVTRYSFGFEGGKFITSPENSGAALTDNDIADSSSALGGALAAKANSSALAAVATTGDYADLNNKPTIPSAYGPFTAREEAVASQTREQTSYGKGGAATSDGNGNTWSSAFPKNTGTLALQEGIAPAFSTSSTYAVGDYVTHEGLLYKCTTAVTTAGAWNAANWSAVAVTDEMGADTPLPFDAEVEYVTVPVGAYVLPEVKTISPQINLSAQIRLQSAPSSSAMFFIGNWSGSGVGSNQIKFNSASNCTVMNGNGAEKTLSNSGVVGQFGEVAIQGSLITIGTATASQEPSSAGRVPLDIGIGACVLATGGVDNMTITGVATDIASFTFRSGGAITRGLVPVRVGTTGYLYDKVSGRLFGSAVPSIPLICGPDKATPTITTPDRLVEIDERNNYLPYASTTTLAPETAVYRATATLSGTTATMPAVAITGIPTASAYFAFELEVAVDATATALDDTAWSAWTWQDGGELPTADYAGKTLYIACRLDCTARTIKANCYDVR